MAILTFGLALYLCTREHVVPWIFGQFILAGAILQWFFLLQKFAHGKEIRSPALNLIGGHVASLFCLLPFNQWRFLNTDHAENAPKAIPIKKKLFPPLNVLAYSVKNYWNIKKLFSLFPEKRTRVHFVMSMLVMNVFFMLIMPNVPMFWKKFGLGYFLFLVLVERWLMRQEEKRTAL